MMIRKVFQHYTLCVVALLSLVGCKTAVEGDPAYSLAHSCVSIKGLQSGEFVVSQSGEYQLSAVDESDAEAFYLRPTELGAFMLYDRNQQFFGLEFLSLKPQADPGDTTEWKIKDVVVKQGSNTLSDTYTLISYRNELRLAHRNSQFALPKASVAPVSLEQSVFQLSPRPAEACAQFPEDDLDAIISDAFYDSGEAREKVVGFADIHTHLALPKAMASVVMSGDVFHRYGIKHALKGCDHIHGRNGALDLLGMQTQSNPQHQTSGFPDFPHWPNRANISHTTAYYRWIERSYLAGLRLIVTHATGNPQFCQLMGMVNIGKQQGDCTPADTVRRQTEYVYELQDYIDAQSGGPGKGWFRVATSSAQARSIIQDNKLAVVLGSEYGNLFDCRSSNVHCDEAYIDRELDKLYDLGVRAVFPIHRFDNAFGGALYEGVTWMHLSSKLSTGNVDHLTDMVNPGKLLFKPLGGNFFDMERCPAGVQGDKEAPSMREFFETEFSVVTNAFKDIPLLGNIFGSAFDAVFLNKLEPIPDYAHLQESTSNCNARTLQGVGRHLVNRIIDKGMILEVDHMSYNTLMETLAIVEARQYSGVVSSHGMVRDTERSVERIYRLGGIAVDFPGTPSQSNQNLQKFKQVIQTTGYEPGVGFGSDVQGIVTFGFGDEGFVPQYPFPSYDGKVTFTRPTIGNRTIDFVEEGMAHYGMFPEWIENFRQVSQREGTDSFELFMNSAEAYLQMWERAESAALPNQL